MKTIQPPTAMELTEDEKCRLAYIRLLLRSLKAYKKATQPHELYLSPEDKKIIEYHALNMTRHAVNAHISLEDCVALFQQRIIRLTTRSEEDWIRINEIITENKKLLKPSDKEDFRDMVGYFLRTNTTIEA